MPPVTRRILRFELVLVLLVSMLVLAPGIQSYSLVDPWETHYGEVARTMLQDNDFVHTEWRGTYVGGLQDNEGFRSKPVLMFWLMAAGMESVGVAQGGSYSGEMTATDRVMIGIRLPFILCAIAGLALVWWMLARLVNRRVAWLALLVVGSAPMFCLIARNAIPDMPLVACTMGAIALFAMAVEDGDRAITPVGTIGRFRIDARHVVMALLAAGILIQAAYYCLYFITAPALGVRNVHVSPALWLPAVMILGLVALGRDGWLVLRLPFVLIGGIVAAIVDEPMAYRAPGQSRWRHVFDDILGAWDRHSADRYVVRALSYPIVWAQDGTWRDTAAVAERVIALRPIITMRQLYLLGCYFLLGISILAKGPPGIAVVGMVGVLYVILLGRWRELYEGGFELKRAILVILTVALPWHVAMYLKDGQGFINEYLYQHILNRASQGVDNSTGTFAYYTSQIGHGLWLWAALLPGALGAAFARADRATRVGRVRFLVVLWAIAAVAVFCLVETKFHHYFLPAIVPLALLVAFFLDDLLARRERLHPVLAGVGAGIVLLLCRDLMYEPERWIEMFVFRYDRPWPGGEPWSIDPSDGFLGLGIAAAIAVLLGATRFVRLGVTTICVVGLAIGVWALQVYMPIAGTHWGMGDAAKVYYQQRTIYGVKRVAFGAGGCVDAFGATPERYSFETVIPDPLYTGQPMTVTLQVNKVSDVRAMVRQVALVGHVTAVGDHTVTVTLAPGESAKARPLVGECQREVAAYPGLQRAYASASAEAKKAGTAKPPEPLRGRRVLQIIDADPLVAWQLYWRGENFWSGGEIWGLLLEQKTAFPNPDNKEFMKYIGDRSRAPLGRRYFMLTDSGRQTTAKGILPTERAKATYEVLDQTSNKFSMSAFWL